MQKAILIIGTLVLCGFANWARAEMPPNVRCAIMAQEAARNMGRKYQETYNRKFELCMLNAMPQEKQTSYLIERLRPYVAISPGPSRHNTVRGAQESAAGTWVRVSPNLWVLER